MYKKPISRLGLWIIPLVLVLSTSNINAQRYKEGFLIRSSGDTIKGLVKYQLSDQDVVLFKTSSKAQSQSFKANEVAGFGFTQGRFYSSENIDLEGAPTLSFYDNLIIGELSLLKDDKGFLLRKEDRIGRINQNDRSRPLPEQTKTYRENVRMISSFVVGCNRTLIDEVGFENSEKSLIALVKAYHQCRGVSFREFNNEKPWIKLNPSVVIGFNRSSINFEGNIEFPVVDQLGFDPVMSIFPGMELLITSPRTSEDVGILIGLHYQVTDYRGMSNTGNSILAYHNDMIIRYSFLRIPFGVAYRLPTNSRPIWVKGGVQFGTNLALSQERVEYTIIGGSNATTRLTEYDDEFSRQIVSRGLWFGLGTEFDLVGKFTLTIDLRQEFNSSISIYNSDTSNLQLLVGIKL